MNIHHNKIIDQFTRQSSYYRQQPGDHEAASLRLLVKLAETTRQDTVLDVACGAGILACAFAKIANNVTGVDLTPAMLQQAKLVAREYGLTNVTWKVGNAERLPFQDDTFSIVVSRYAFHHFQRPKIVLSEMMRVCCPGGKILIVDTIPQPAKIAAYNHFEKLLDPSHHSALTLKQFQALFDDAGLENVRTELYGLKMELEYQLARSFPNSGDEEKIRQLLQNDLDVDNLGIGVQLVDKQIHYTYPIVALVGEKVR
jgi:ubiquinone/menaquinone biosynthesis C-methylase UbiE